MLLIRRLLWDAFNVPHIARHGVTPEEVKEVCQGRPVVQLGKKGRSLVFGPTNTGRMLTVVLDAVPETSEDGYYPVTARPASRRERDLPGRARR
jgi:uncharacterized DUF497 family protein